MLRPLLLLLTLLPSQRLCAAEPQVRKYVDPGYRKIGVYAGGPRTYFDYQLTKMSFGDKFPNKRNWWAERKKAKVNENEICTIFIGLRGGQSFEKMRSRIDGWLKPEPGIPTYPETIPAICLEEENVASRSQLMDKLARHIRKQYRIPVFQWYTDPFGPSTQVTADGWIWDSYGWSPTRFRRHVMSFVLLGKPVICVPWATDPHWPQWTQYRSTADLINREWHQFTTCMEFNVSTAPFCVAGLGAMNPWLGGSSADMKLLRNALRTKRRQMRAIRPGTLPLPTANFSAAARAILVGGSAEKPSRYVEGFGGTQIAYDATISGFLDLMVTSRPATPGYLVIRPRPKQGKNVRRPVRASLTYHLRSYFPLKSVTASVTATAPNAVGAKNTISISTSEIDDQVRPAAVQLRQEQFDTLVGKKSWKPQAGIRDVFVTIGMSQQNGRSDVLSHQLDNLKIECEHYEPEGKAVAKLQADQYGGLSYHDDFTTNRWPHFGNVRTSFKTHGGFRGAGFWVGLKGGFPITTVLTQRFSSPRPLKELNVGVSGYANGPDLGGTITIIATPRGKKSPRWTIASKGRHRGLLTLKVPSKQLNGLREFDVAIVLRSVSGVEQGKKACATIDSIRINGK